MDCNIADDDLNGVVSDESTFMDHLQKRKGNSLGKLM